MAEMMRARHEVFGVKDVADTKYNRENGWEPVDPATPTTEQERRRVINDARRGTLNERPAAEVVDALEVLPEEDKDAVKAAEKSGKGRKTVLDA